MSCIFLFELYSGTYSILNQRNIQKYYMNSQSRAYLHLYIYIYIYKIQFSFFLDIHMGFHVINSEAESVTRVRFPKHCVSLMWHWAPVFHFFCFGYIGEPNIRGSCNLHEQHAASRVCHILQSPTPKAFFSVLRQNQWSFEVFIDSNRHE